MAELAIKELLECPGWEMRSFNAIRNRVGGFTEDHLRRLLVRSGAIQFWGEKDPATGKRRELWGLLSKNRHHLPRGHDKPSLDQPEEDPIEPVA